MFQFALANTRELQQQQEQQQQQQRNLVVLKMV